MSAQVKGFQIRNYFLIIRNTFEFGHQVVKGTVEIFFFYKKIDASSIIYTSIYCLQILLLLIVCFTTAHAEAEFY